MKTFKMKLQIISMMLLFTFASVQIARASAKDGEASVVEGTTVTISLSVSDGKSVSVFTTESDGASSFDSSLEMIPITESDVEFTDR